MPPITRQTIRSQIEKQRADPIALTANSNAVTTIVGGRPNRSATPPANQAPTADPSSADATAVPSRKLPGSNVSRIALVAPLMTDESNPKRRPPSAAASASPVTP